MNRRTLPLAPSSRLAKQRSSTSRPWADLDELEPEATALATEKPSRMSRPTRAREAARTGEATAAGAVGAEGGEGDELEGGVEMPAELGIGVEAEGDELEEGLKVPAELGVEAEGDEGDEGGFAAEVVRPVEVEEEQRNAVHRTLAEKAAEERAAEAKEAAAAKAALKSTLTLTLTLSLILTLTRCKPSRRATRSRA